MVVLRHFQRPGVQINQLAASTFSLATQLFDEHSGCSDFHALAIILLEGEVRQGFGLDDISQSENLVGKLTMGAFALSRQLAFYFRIFGADCRVTFRWCELLAFFPCAVRVKTMRVRGSLRPVHGTLQAAGFFPWLNHGVAEFHQRCGVVADHSNRARTDVQTNDFATSLLVLGRGDAFLHELHKPAA
ncbi:hypothetical protein FEMY_24980 [Ferrovum myxofaciens]|uniref:Uncharacterized protein n=1 Tax=Ferrovum myxofaciens TaxID=416213 RepID=A0A149VVM6_9PROT|nr:hypothetical protein FEMY_24980 [Ferrovum myxofaciens]